MVCLRVSSSESQRCLRVLVRLNPALINSDYQVDSSSKMNVTMGAARVSVWKIFVLMMSF